MTSLEAILPQPVASIGSDSVEASATDTGMAALLGMWTTIFQQQVLPEPVAVEAGTAWQESGNSAVTETQASETSGSGKGAPVGASEILGLVGGQADQASILWQPLPEPAGAAIAAPETKDSVSLEVSVPMALPPEVLATSLPATPMRAEIKTPEISVAPVEPPPKEVISELPAFVVPVMQTNEPVLPIPGPQKPKSSDSAIERVEVEREISANPAPAPAIPNAIPTVEPPPQETVVNLKRKVSERILPKVVTLDVQPPVEEPVESTSKAEPTPTEVPLPEQTAAAGLPDPAAMAESAPIEELELPVEQPVPDVAPRQESPVLKAAADEPSPPPAMHSLEPAPRAVSGAAPQQAPPPVPAAQRSKPAFAPEPPPAPAAMREAKTISIRIPLNDSSAATGAPIRHLDLIFNQRNNDLTLQFRSPNTEIQGRIEESMPNLLDKLQIENWTSRPADLAAKVAQPELAFDGRRRTESLLPAANQFDSLREPIATAGSSSQGFNFDDSPADRKDAQEQSRQGRNRKKEQAWQSEFDEQLEP